jgi:hypothetical protein
MGEAADRFAAISREQWEEYKKFGVPIEDKLLAMRKNGAALETNLSAAQGLAKDVGLVSASEANRRLAGYGVAQTNDQATVNARLNTLSNTANMASARDFVRGSTTDRDRMILVGGAPNDGLQNLGG